MLTGSGLSPGGPQQGVSDSLIRPLSSSPSRLCLAQRKDDQVVEDLWEPGEEEVAGVLTIVYDHHQRELTQHILDIQHRQYVHVVATTHVHMDHHDCLETIIIRGMPTETERLSLEIGGLRGVRFAELTGASKVEN
ncbi:hypothetical protein G3480_09350 [Thiorhodococcus mannitoliphagus]|uniref:Transcription factor NikR nickel binding C-terminal domain-containing protein n=1 Tax=Thiorhodococcus mannitoliphagus TaxID=329406 RepID=A0A6P1DWL3_9GAMM|nr:hypothetical protein [Thiorhodococcus mannitoliphagus]